MERLFTALFLAIFCTGFVNAHSDTWKQFHGLVQTQGIRELNPVQYKAYYLNGEELKAQLFNVSSEPANGITVYLPAPDGVFRSYKIWERSNMEPALAAKYPEIKSFTGHATEDKSVLAILDYSPRGFHAMILDGTGTYFIDPYSNVNDGYYICYYKRDYNLPATKELVCNLHDGVEDQLPKGRMNVGSSGLPDIDMPRMTNGTDKRSYRLALACTGEYAKAVDATGPSKTNVLAAMNTSLNRINGVFRSEVGIELLLIANNDTLIYLDPNSDPYTTNNVGVLRTENQIQVNSVIGSAGYDIGHVFDGGTPNGIAELGCVCNDNAKAMAATGHSTPVGDAFDIDFVIHEMGHQFNANHTFNAATGACGNNNGRENSAYEPGGGSTIMAYAGLCSINNIQSHSDNYFHAHSLEQINAFVTSTGASCAVANPSGNTPATVSSIGNTINIPYLTPFELIAPLASDTDHDALTYAWEEWDLGDFGFNFAQTEQGPIFRSFKGTASDTRVFPVLDSIRGNVTNYLGEKLPSVERVMLFKLTVRDILNGWGVFNTSSDDLLTIRVVNTNTPFRVTSPNAKTDYWQVNNPAKVTWDVSNTTAAPISTAGVDIYLSLDDGKTFPFLLAQNVPNTGVADVAVPAGSNTASARVKIKGAGNIFFDISNEGFVINEWPANVNEVAWANDITIFPMPAKDVLNVSISNSGNYKLILYNTLGQQVLSRDIYKNAELSVGSLANGFYYLQLTDFKTGERLEKQVLKQ